jgi:hypothetical protein
MQKPVPHGHSALQRVSQIEIGVVGPQTRLASPVTRHLHAWWQRANGGAVPPKRQFDITDHARIAANVFLVEALADGDFLFRVVGEQVVHLIGRNNAGKRVSSAPRSDVGHALEAYYRSIVEERVCKSCTGSLAFAYRDYWRFESLDCPFAVEDGRIGYIIGVIALLS